jgi:hypothetical protein
MAVGPAAFGVTSADVWNTYAAGLFDPSWGDTGVLKNLVLADGQPTSVQLTVANANGAWGVPCADVMFQTYVYPSSRQGVITVTLDGLPEGDYEVYVYAHGEPHWENAALSLNAGAVDFGTLTTSGLADWNSSWWVEGNQYVVFRGVTMRAGDPMVLTAAGVGDIAVINGLQVVRLESERHDHRAR